MSPARRLPDPPGFDRPGYEDALRGLRTVLAGPAVSAPSTAVDLAELKRLVRAYPEHAREILAELDGPDTAAG